MFTIKQKCISMAILLLVLGLSGCASNIPRSIRETVKLNPDVRVVRDEPSAYQGKKAKWGGRIVGIKNLKRVSEVELLAAQLDSWGEPGQPEDKAVRFLARVSAFLDPQIFQIGRKMTVFGTVDKQISRKIGEHPYPYPVIAVKDYHLWPEETVYDDGYYGFYIWSPWWYGYPHPYRHHGPLH